MKTLGTLKREAALRPGCKAKDHPAYRYDLTAHYKITAQAEQLKKYHDSKKGKAT